MNRRTFKSERPVGRTHSSKKARFRLANVIALSGAGIDEADFFTHLDPFSFLQTLSYQSRLLRSVLSRYQAETYLFRARHRHDRVRTHDHFQNCLVPKR